MFLKAYLSIFKIESGRFISQVIICLSLDQIKALEAISTTASQFISLGTTKWVKQSSLCSQSNHVIFNHHNVEVPVVNEQYNCLNFGYNVTLSTILVSKSNYV